MIAVQNDYSRQINILNPEEFKTRINIVGVGATGSWMSLALAKMGLNKLHLYDFDTVGVYNLPNQMFGLRDVEHNKAHSMRNIIKMLTGFVVKSKDEKLEGDTPLQGIVFMLTDTMKSRKDIYYKAIK